MDKKGLKCILEKVCLNRDEESLLQIINSFMPIIKKFAYQLN